MSSIPRATSDIGTIAPELYAGEPRVDEILRQFGREWARSTNLKFREADQRLDRHALFVMSAPPGDVWRERPIGVLYFGPGQPVEDLNPHRMVNIGVSCFAEKAEDAMELCWSMYRLLRPSSNAGAGGPFIRVPRLASMNATPGIPVELVDKWPVDGEGDRYWRGWQNTVVNIGRPPQLLGRTGDNPDGSSQAEMMFQCQAAPRTITAPPATIEISSTNDRASVEVFALPRVGSDGVFSIQEEFLQLRWNDGTDQSVVIDFDDDPTIAELKDLVEAESGWTFTINDPGDALGIAAASARHLYSTHRINVTAIDTADLRVVQEN